MSEARIAILREHWSTAASAADIEAMINDPALPGRPLSKKAIGMHAWRLGLRRPAGSRGVRPGPVADAPPAVTDVAPAPIVEADPPPPEPEAVEPSAPTAPAAVVRPPPVPIPRPAAVLAPSEPVSAEREQIRHWAAQRGIPSDGPLDLALINTRRRNLGMPPFVLREPAPSRRQSAA